jgi:glycerate 2-kinase
MTLHEDPRRFLLNLFEAAVRAVQPAACLRKHLPAPPKGRLVILAAGKAAAAMAAEAEAFYEERWPGTEIEGIAITRYGHTIPTNHVAVHEAGHPFPDGAGENASRGMLSLANSLREEDLAVVLLSGGASALLSLPPTGVKIEEKQKLTRALLSTGAPIADINCVRRHLSCIKGGRLAEAIYPARSITLAISDVAGNEPSVIASGPTVPAHTTALDALSIIERFRVPIAEPIIECFKQNLALPAPDAPCFDRANFRIIATGSHALSAAAALAREAGCEVSIVGDELEASALELATSHARMARSHTNPGVPRIILSGGEATVALGKTHGAGGPNQEFALALALELQGERNVHALACDTDGIDGGSGAASDPAGAVISSRTLSRAKRLGLDAEMALAGHDAGTFFQTLGDLITTGPTLTNVNDFRAILVSA